MFLPDFHGQPVAEKRAVLASFSWLSVISLHLRQEIEVYLSIYVLEKIRSVRSSSDPQPENSGSLFLVYHVEVCIGSIF